MYAFTLGSFVFFTVLVAFITWMITRRDNRDTSDGYFLGGRVLTGGYIAGSLLLTNLSTEQLVGLNGSAFRDGLSVMAWEVIAGFSLVVMALYFLPRYLKSGITTIPQFLELRFNHTTRTITSLIFIVAYTGILLPIILYSGAIGMNTILEIKTLFGFENDQTALWFTVWLTGIIGSIYAIFGGLRSIAVSDCLYGFGLLTGGILITWLAFAEISPEAPLQALPLLMQQHPEKFNSLGGANQSVPFSTLFTGVLLLNLFYWCTNQQIIQRAFAATSLKEGQKGVLLAGVFKILAPLILVIPGIAAFHLYGVYREGETQERLVDVIVEPTALIGHYREAGQTSATEIILYNHEAARLIEQAQQPSGATSSSTVPFRKGTLEIVKTLSRGDVITEDSQGKSIYRSGLTEQELNSLIPPRNRDRAYGTLVRNVLPPYLVGFFAAVIIGAILTSFNSVLNSTSTLFSLGVYKAMIHPDASEKQVILTSKIFGSIIAVVSMFVAPLLEGQDSLFSYLQKMNGLYFIPIFAVVLVGMLSRFVPSAAANIALISGFAVIAVGYFVPMFSDWVAKIHEFHFLGLVFVSLVSFMLIMGKLAPRDTPWVQQATQDVDQTPWKWAKPVGFSMIATVLAIYIWFADFSTIL